jgi:hypothetical protein
MPILLALKEFDCSASHMLSTKRFDERHNGLTVFPKLLLVRNSALHNHLVVIDHPPWSPASECREYICAAASLLSCRLHLCACSFCSRFSCLCRAGWHGARLWVGQNS